MKCSRSSLHADTSTSRERGGRVEQDYGCPAPKKSPEGTKGEWLNMASMTACRRSRGRDLMAEAKSSNVNQRLIVVIIMMPHDLSQITILELQM
jgi:hypothetical protein